MDQQDTETAAESVQDVIAPTDEEPPVVEPEVDSEKSKRKSKRKKEAKEEEEEGRR